MTPPPIFSSPAQAFNVMFSMLARLSALVMWLLLALAHLALLVTALATCWALDITAQDLKTAWLHMRQTTPGEVLSFAGASAATLLAAWLWVLRKVHKAAANGWLTEYLMRGL